MPFSQIDVDALPERHPVAVFNTFWLSAAAGKPVAPWDRFDAAEHPKILPWILLLKHETCTTCAGGSHLRYAVCGTGCTQMFGASYEGELFGADMPPEAIAQRQEEFDRVMAGSGPLFSETHIPFPNRDYVRIYRGVFPFTTDGRIVDRIMVIIADVARQIYIRGGGVHLVTPSDPRSRPPNRPEAPHDTGDQPAEDQEDERRNVDGCGHNP